MVCAQFLQGQFVDKVVLLLPDLGTQALDCYAFAIDYNQRRGHAYMRFPEQELKAQVEAIQGWTHALLLRAEDAIVNLINDLEKAKKDGVPEDKLVPIFEFQRKAQWRVGFVNAENSMGFHASQEAARVLGEAIDYGRQGQLALIKLVETLPEVEKKFPVSVIRSRRPAIPKAS